MIPKLVLVCGLTFCLAVQDKSPQPVSVGFPGRWQQVVLPGPELIARPIEDRTKPIVLRIENTYPHGTDFRYDLVYIGLEPGQFNLSDFLIRRDGGPRQDLPTLLVEIQTVLPPGQVRPGELTSAPTRFNSYYLISLLVVAMVWVLGLLALIFGRRVREQQPLHRQQSLSMADRLRPLVQRATQGQLTSQERAELERMLINYWRERLRVQDLPADKLIKYLKQHEEAGQLLRKLEEWLHSPRGANEASIAEILKPYESS